MSAIGEPTANAYMFVIDSNDKQYDAYFDIKNVGGYYEGEIRYRPFGSPLSTPWVYLSAVQSTGVDTEFDSNKMLTSEATDAEIDTVLKALNGGLKKVFGGGAVAKPEKGIERVLWMLKNNAITESDNVLKRE